MNEDEQFKRGVAHFNAHEFFEAHEVWEELWLRAPAEEKPLFQGVIQIAAAFHHYRRGNLTGTASLLAAGLARIEAAPPNWHGVDIRRLHGDAKACLGTLQASQNWGLERIPRIERIPT